MITENSLLFTWKRRSSRNLPERSWEAASPRASENLRRQKLVSGFSSDGADLTFRVYGEFLLGQCCTTGRNSCVIAILRSDLADSAAVGPRAEEENIRIQRAVDEGLGEFLGDILYMKGMTHLGIGEWKEADQSLAVLEER